MKLSFYSLCTSICVLMNCSLTFGQTIDVPAGSPLTVNGNLNLPTGYSLQYSGQNYLTAPAANSNNTILGLQAGTSVTGTSNTFLGFQAGRVTTSGGANVFLGSQAGYSNTAGTGNLFLGQQAGYQSTGSYNLFMGNSSGSATTSGVGNTAIGDGSLLNNTTGQRNTAIGQYAGGSSTGDYNVFIGFATGVPQGSSGINNAVAIGPYAQVSQSNSIVLGGTGGTGANVGIGTSAPSTKLHIVTGVANSSGLRLANLTNGSPATALNQTKFLSVDGSGNVILASSNSSARVGAESWSLMGDNLQNTNGGGVIIGSGVSQTPAGYKLYVEQGILTERIKVALRSSSEWSDYVFAPGYRLRSLGEVEEYIRSNGHLPGLASAEQMVTVGNDLHQTDAKLLEKIEELTLYTIQLEKENKQQRIINDKQNATNGQLQAEIGNLKILLKQIIDKK